MKKILKNILMQFVFALSVFGIVGCQEYSIDSQPDRPINIQVNAKDSYTMLATSPTNVNFGISANTPWTISCDQQWCTVTPSSSGLSALVSEVVVAAESNATFSERTATITIKAEGIAEEKVISIIQKSKENLVVIPYDEVVSSEGEKISFNIISNKPWEIIPSTQFLEKIDKVKGEGNENGEKETITIDVTPNPGAIRSGEIKVRTAFEEYIFSISQDGVVLELEEPTETATIDFTGAAGEQTFKIKSNHDWKVKSADYPEWIKAEKTAEGELKITVTESNRLSTRSANIMLETEDIIPGFDGVALTVTQKPNFRINCDESKIEIDEATGDVKLSEHKVALIESLYKFKKGKVVIEFSEVALGNTSTVKINLGVMRCELKPGKPLGGEGSFFFNGNGLNWSRDNFETTVEAAKAMRKIEISLQPNTNDNKYTSSLVIDGQKVGGRADKVLNGSPEAQISLDFLSSDEADFVKIKSITYYPAE